MKTKKDYTRLQGILAVCSFTCGVIIACICLFVVPPPGDISSSAISIVSELLVLCGALLGIKVGFDTKMQRFEARFNNRLQNIAAGDTEDQNNGED
jgi:hypothetical protein